MTSASNSEETPTGSSQHHLSAQADFDAVVTQLSPTEDLLLVKIMLTNLPIINAHFGDDEGLAVQQDIAARIAALPHTQLVATLSPVLFGLIAEDASNPERFIHMVKEVITEINISGIYRFLIEASIGAVRTEHETDIGDADWMARLNLALLKSTRTGAPEIADEQVAHSEGVRQRLARLSPGSAVPEGMYWVFQPINVTATGELFGFEALCRWNVPGLGYVSPEIFIQVAEDMNLVQVIDFWAMAAVEHAYPELVKRGGQIITINVSVQTLTNDHEFFSAVDRILPKIMGARFSLAFELTETSMVRNQIDLGASLNSLRKRGAKIAIDDFGTGQTSLSTISSLPTDFVKLDGSLLQAERPDLSKGLLELGMSFARLVGAKVIVEKVETQADLDLAREVGADYVQGWFFGQPVDLRETTETSMPSPSPATG